MAADLKMLATQVGGMFLVIGIVMFVAAGTVAWPAGWLFLILFFAFTVAIGLWLLANNPQLLAERMTGMGKAEKKWDKVFLWAANIAFFGWLIVMPLDAVRFQVSQMPVWLQVAGLILLLISFYFFFLIFRENSYLSPAVRIQSERGQTVIATGPYQYVRHPMYATAALFLVGVSLLLGSWYGVLMALVVIVLVAIRAVHEEEALRAELPGYAAYMAEVKYRLIPYVW
jgi:protein-S-isoprenylcysteine O-methyltransferase Ste14